MFGSRAPEDDFRKLLKTRLGYSEDEGTISNELKLTEIARVLGTSNDIVLSWTRGLSRPTPREEERAIVVLRALQNFENS